MGYIYRISKKDTGKSYIGQTVEKNVNTRWRSHLKNNSNCIYLRNALKKHGKDAFNFDVICEVSNDLLGELEDQYIDMYDCIVPKGYNLRKGGIGGGHHHEETKRKISEILKNGRARTNPEFHMKPVSQYTKDDVFVRSYFSCTDAGRAMECDASQIIGVCKGKRPSCRGFKWKYGGPKKEVILKKHLPKQHSQMKKVIQSKDGVDIKTYISVSEAAREIGVASTNISKACVRRGTSKGFNWRYEGEPPILKTKVKKKVIQSKDGVDIATFDSVTEAYNHMGISSPYMSMLCNGKRPSYKGFQFRFHR